MEGDYGQADFEARTQGGPGCPRTCAAPATAADEAAKEEKKEESVELVDEKLTAKTPKIRLMLIGLSFSTLCLFIR